MLETHLGSPEWVKAQEAEIKWWIHYFKEIRFHKNKEGNEAIRKYAKEQMEILMNGQTHHIPPSDFEIENAMCLEVGCGPIPFLIDWPNAKLRLAIDPLFSEYTVFNHFKMGEKNFGVWCHPIKAENFHYWHNKKFDIIICSNVLDHSDDPKIVLEMMLSNLAEDGMIYLDCFLREPGLREEHPHGWKDAGEFEKWIKPILGDHFKVKYAKVVREKKHMPDGRTAIVVDGQTDKPVQRIFLKIVWDDKLG